MRSIDLLAEAKGLFEEVIVQCLNENPDLQKAGPQPGQNLVMLA